ncbi:MAG: hypothetical protein JXA57_17335 [Armatimonadetes bacterium]|nr:hypothetical protein [Armatimonadota bacterium]
MPHAVLEDGDAADVAALLQTLADHHRWYVLVVAQHPGGRVLERLGPGAGGVPLVA